MLQISLFSDYAASIMGKFGQKFTPNKDLSLPYLKNTSLYKQKPCSVSSRVFVFEASKKNLALKRSFFHYSFDLK